MCSIKKSNSVVELDFDALDYVDLYDYKNYNAEFETYNLTTPELKSIILWELSSHNQFISIDDRVKPIDNDVVEMILKAKYDNKFIIDDEKYHYSMGSNEFSNEFDSYIRNVCKGESANFQILFPEDFENVDFAGKNIDFDIKLKKIKRNIDISDEEFITAYFNCENMNDVYAKIEKESNKQAIFEKIYNEICQNSNVKRIPKTLNKYLETSINKFSDIESSENLKNTQNELESWVYEFLILKAISEKENITYTRDDYIKERDKLAQENNLTPVEIEHILDSYTICYYMMQSVVFDIISLRYL